MENEKSGINPASSPSPSPSPPGSPRACSEEGGEEHSGFRIQYLQRKNSMGSVVSESAHEGSPNDIHFLVEELRRNLTTLRRQRLRPHRAEQQPQTQAASDDDEDDDDDDDDDIDCPPLQPLTNRDLEFWATLIYESMSGPSRTFHSVQHVFDISDGSNDPVHVVSAFFHDVVYYNIDGGLSPDQADILAGVIEEEEDGGGDGKSNKGKGSAVVRVSDTIATTDRLIGMTMKIFGFEPGQVLNPFSGLNEFLSAALAVRCLAGVVDDGHLASIAACIERTVPFRGPNPNSGVGPVDALFDNLVAADAEYDLGLSDDRMVSVVQTSVRLANRDVANFATRDYSFFLASTWDLLPESNIDLRPGSVYRCKSFTFALQKMLGFLQNLDPTNIYASFRGVPSREALDDLFERTEANLSIAVKYLQLKILGLSVVAALAELTGGDAPLLMFVRGLRVVNDDDDDDEEEEDEDGFAGKDFASLDEEDVNGGAGGEEDREEDGGGGDSGGSNGEGEERVASLRRLGSGTRPSRRPMMGDRQKSFIKNFGTVRRSSVDVQKNPIVYDLLKEGRREESKFDVANSPLSAYLYGLIGDEGLDKSMQHAAVPMDAKRARALLDSLPAEGVRIIANSCARIVVTRSKELKVIARHYSR